ncbi:MAG: hypothetical protein DRR06_17095 [Gammaproteobacteria bacterium]|nr:MAG: hypothetical protein DRR06_17095 [Gammaproteobacteria bacterium]
MKCNKCTNCGFTVLDLEGGVFLGRNFSYWVELESKAERLDVTNLMDEIVRLKAKLFSYQEIEKLYKDIK